MKTCKCLIVLFIFLAIFAGCNEQEGNDKQNIAVAQPKGNFEGYMGLSFEMSQDDAKIFLENNNLTIKKEIIKKLERKVILKTEWFPYH